MSISAASAVATRPCAYCGKPVPARMNHCPFCREAVPEVKLSPRFSSEGRQQIRRGLLYMLLAGVIYYFAGGYSNFKMPVRLPPPINVYLAPAVFLGGLAMTLYGLFKRMRS